MPLQLIISILLEQFVWFPIIYSLWDIPFPMLLRGGDVEEIPSQVQSTIGGLLWDNFSLDTSQHFHLSNPTAIASGRCESDGCGMAIHTVFLHFIIIRRRQSIIT